MEGSISREDIMWVQNPEFNEPKPLNPEEFVAGDRAVREKSGQARQDREKLALLTDRGEKQLDEDRAIFDNMANRAAKDEDVGHDAEMVA